VRRERVSDDHWIYVPDPAVRFNRVSETINYAPGMAPEGCTGLCAEIACDEDDAVWRDADNDQVSRVVKDLVAIGLLRAADPVEASWVRRFRGAYPLYTLDWPMSRTGSWRSATSGCAAGRALSGTAARRRE
jgi:protoporphyrinogen oxidase